MTDPTFNGRHNLLTPNEFINLFLQKRPSRCCALKAWLLIEGREGVAQNETEAFSLAQPLAAPNVKA